MVLSRITRIFGGALLFFGLALCFSCEKTFPGLILCSDCLSEEPQTAVLELKLSLGSSSQIHIEVFEGNLNDGILYRSYETASTLSNVTVIMNKKYTITATYYFPGENYKVVNSVTPYTVYDESQCEKACYYVRDKVVDLRLKRY